MGSFIKVERDSFLALTLGALLMIGAGCGWGLDAPSELPMYGNVERTPKQKLADTQLLQDAIDRTGSREAAAQDIIAQAWDFFAEKKLGLAMRRFNQAWLLTPNNADIFFGFGQVLIEKGQSAEGQEFLDQAKALTPETSELYCSRGNAFLKKGRFLDRAIADFNKAIDLNRAYAPAYTGRGNVYMAMGDTGKATTDYDQAIEMNPKYPEAYYKLGIFFMGLGDFDRALYYYGKTLEMAPEHHLTYLQRAILYYTKQDYDKSWEDVGKAEELGAVVDSAFLKKLKKDSGREKADSVSGDPKKG